MSKLLLHHQREIAAALLATEDPVKLQLGTMKVTISRKSGVETDEPMPEPFPPDPGSEHDDSWWR